MWYDLVVLLDVFVCRFELMLLLLVDAVESLQLPIGLKMVYSDENMLDSMAGQILFEKPAPLALRRETYILKAYILNSSMPRRLLSRLARFYHGALT